MKTSIRFLQSSKGKIRKAGLGLMALSFIFVQGQAQVIKPFSPRTPDLSPGLKIYKIKGDFTIIGNTNLQGQSGISSNASNMEYVDVDGDAATFNSSSATLVLPYENAVDTSQTNIVYAGLYWMGRKDNGGASPMDILVGGQPETLNDGDSHSGYTLNISSQNDNSQGGSSGRKAVYTFAPSGNGTGDVIVFRFYSWKESGDWKSKVTVQKNSGTTETINQTLTDDASDSYECLFDVPYSFGAGGQTIFVRGLSKKRTNTSISSSYFVSTVGGGHMANKASVLFKKAGGAYQTITADSQNILYPSDSLGNMYVGYADVTGYVKSHGVGNYYAANIALRDGNGGSTGYFGGWALVVVYANPAMKSRNIRLFDGYGYVAGNITADYKINVNGFESMPYGDIKAKVGYIAGEGDHDISGDYLAIKNKATSNWDKLSTSANSADNFFNSSIQTEAVRNPSLTNNFGIDVGIIALDNSNNKYIDNNDTSVQFKYGTTQDTYIIPFFGFSIEAFSTEGIVVNDANALSDSLVAASNINPVSLPVVYANILDASGTIITSIAIDSTGNFELSGLGDGNYDVQLSASQGQIGQLPPTDVPAGWVFTGQSNSGGTPDGSFANGKIGFNVSGGDVTGLVLGMNKIPESFDDSQNVHDLRYTGAGFNAIDSSYFNSADADGHISSIVLTGLPTGLDSIRVNGIVYNSTNFPANGIKVPTNNFGYPIQPIDAYLDQSQLNTTIKFPFYAIDNGGAESNVGATYVIPGIPTPVLLDHFDAFANGAVNELEWHTATEVNNKGFIVERSADGRSFQKIGFVSAGQYAANSYVFQDAEPLTVSYYRLKQIDFDGRSTYSVVKQVVRTGNAGKISVYPNPATNAITIRQQGDIIHNAALFNALGQKIQDIAISQPVHSLSVGYLPIGIYYLRIGMETIKIQKQ